jgi:hypothetical protein
MLPPLACGPTPSPPTPGWPAASGRATATTPLAPPPAPGLASVPTPLCSTTRTARAGGSRRWTGCARTSRPGPKRRTAPEARQKLRQWQQDADLAGVRDQGALAKLPQAERARWRQFWSDVADLLQKTDARK